MSPFTYEWKKAEDEELRSLLSMKTWALVPLPKDKKAVKNKWVYKLKRGRNGEVLRYKARQMSKGFTQQARIDYDETFAPTVYFLTIRTLLALSTGKN